VKFNPEQWAKVTKDAGMKYMIFTTKHHDGFCMFDTKYTDFSIAHYAFKDNPRRDVAKYVFDAFRKQGFMIGAYFSKPDWHSQYYWWDVFPTVNRNVNYDIKKYPQHWDMFKSYVYGQIQELMTGYGSIDTDSRTHHSRQAAPLPLGKLFATEQRLGMDAKSTFQITRESRELTD
jgi:alpha-L-fucosidase